MLGTPYDNLAATAPLIIHTRGLETGEESKYSQYTSKEAGVSELLARAITEIHI